MKFHSKIQVRWDDLDAFNHVNNAAYLTYIQEARADLIWYSRAAIGKEPVLADMVVARNEVDYLIPLYNGGYEVDVYIWCSRIGNASFDLEYEIKTGEGTHARLKSVQVCVDMESKRSRRLRDEEKAFLLEYFEEPKKD
jgi:acyl-CoA thioester hydrolase